MSNELLKYAFVAGELSSSLYGRTDLTKYDLAMAEAYNFFVDYRGGLSSRPGTEFVGWLPDYDEASDGGRALENIPGPFLFPMKIEAETEYNYLISVAPVNEVGTNLFSHSVIRFVYNGAYNLEQSQNVVSYTVADPIVFTVTAHGYDNGDWVQFSSSCEIPELQNRTFQVTNKTADTFRLLTLDTNIAIDASDLDLSSPDAGGVARVYTLTCTYTPDQYAEMRWEQSGNLIRITHRAHPIRNLIWFYDGSLGEFEDEFGKGWLLEDEVIGIDAVGPEITTHTASATGLAEVLFAVCAVYEGDQESVRGPVYKLDTIVNYTATEGSVSIEWAADPDALYYNVYRSVVSVTEVLTSGAELGFVGRTRSTKFTDPNIIPDFSRTPPKQHNPFAPNRIVRVYVTDGGTGYADFGTEITLTGSVGDGEGFFAEAVVDEAGVIVNAVVLNEGHDYNFPPTSTLTVGGGGSGADLLLITSDDIGEPYTYPACSVVYQQRQIYAGTYSRPVTLWGSQVGLASNFDITTNVTDSDSFEFDLDTFNYAPIRHLLASQAGLLAMTQETIWLVNGGGPTDPLTAMSAIATPQNYTGAGKVTPIRVGGDILYTEGKGFAVRVLAYNENSRNFTADDRSILSSHLFGEDRTIVSWAYQESPSKIIWSVREDGALLAFTMVKSEDIYAWTSGGTKGQFLAVAAMREATADPIYSPITLNVVDSVYFVTQRYIGGRWRRMIERMAQRNFANLEEAWCVDCGVMAGPVSRSGQVNITKEPNGLWRVVTETRVGGVPLTPDAVLRGGGGKFLTVDFDPDNDDPLCEALLEPTAFVPEMDNERVIPLRSGQWTTALPFTEIENLWHLEGETVSIVADGVPQDEQVVTNGKVTLPEEATIAFVGLPFTARAKSLPLTSQNQLIEGRRKRIVGMGARVERTKGLQAGRTENELYDVERGGDPILMKNGMLHELLSTSWEDDSSIVFVQSKPLPVTLLSLITDMEVGDDTD